MSTFKRLFLALRQRLFGAKYSGLAKNFHYPGAFCLSPSASLCSCPPHALSPSVLCSNDPSAATPLAQPPPLRSGLRGCCFAIEIAFYGQPSRVNARTSSPARYPSTVPGW